MTRNTNARVAGATLLLYIATGLSALAIASSITASRGPAAHLAAIAAEPWRIQVIVVLSLIMFVYAVVLGVTLYSLTRDHDRELATLGFLFRAGEGLVGMFGAMSTLALLWLATSTAAASLDSDGVNGVAAVLARFDRTSTTISAFSFALGSLAFATVFLRSQSLPRWLAAVGVIASALLVVVLPLQLVGWATGPMSNAVWLPMLVFEVTLAFRLLTKGGAAVTTALDAVP
jgi:hypothetical protein